MTVRDEKLQAALDKCFKDFVADMMTMFGVAPRPKLDELDEHDVAAARELVREGIHCIDDVEVLRGYLCIERAKRIREAAAREREL